MHRIIIFYRLNFENATEKNCPIAKKKLDMFIHKILPSAKELKKILKEKRKQIKVKKYQIEDEMMVYIVTLRILESYHLEFSSTKSVYSQEVLPLAKELLTHHLHSQHFEKTNKIFADLSRKQAQDLEIDNSDYFDNHF